MATYAATGWDHASTIEDVLDRMASIHASLPATDGVARFNRMYEQVTLMVRAAVAGREFEAGVFLERLDVHFANLFFAAYADDLAGRPVAPAWAPLFDARAKPRTEPIQFALAGMNAHICHDLPFAVVTTCREVGAVPGPETPQHVDYTRINAVLEAAAEEIKGWFSTGVVAELDKLGGHLDDRFAMFGIHTARAGAWDNAEMLWALGDHPRMDELFRASLARGVELTGRGLLL